MVGLRWLLAALLILVVHVLGVAQGLRLVPQIGHTSGVNSASFSPDGKLVVTASSDKTARIWDVASGKELRVLAGHADYVNYATFSPDGKTVVTASDDKTARIWEVASGKELCKLTGHTDYVNHAAFSPDSKTVATASYDKTARIWEVASGKELRTLCGHADRVTSAEFSADGKAVVTASHDNTARIWDATTGRARRTLTGHTRSVNTASFCRSGSTVVTASGDRTARLWELSTGRVLRVLTGHREDVYCAVFSPDEKTVLTASYDNTARIWDASTGLELRILKGHGSLVNGASYSPDGLTIATASWDDNARLWAASTGINLATLMGHTNKINHASFSLDGRMIVTAYITDLGFRDNPTWIWDVSTGRELRPITGQSEGVCDTSFSPDGKMVVISAPDMTARVWDNVTQQELRTLIGHTDRVNRASFSLDGKMIVTASEDKTAKIWETATGRELRTLSGHTLGVTSVAFAPDGRTIVTASDDNTVRIWEVATGKELRTLTGPTAEINSASFSPDGKAIVTTSRDNAVRLWDVATGKLLYTRIGFKDGSHIILAPDGRYDSTEGATPTYGHFVQDTPTGPEAVTFDQVNTKEYYVENLLQKINRGEYLPGKYDIREMPITPLVTHDRTKDSIEFTVTDRGGGIGDVQVEINGTIVKVFAKGEVKSGQKVTYMLKDIPAGTPVEVVVWNGINQVSSPRSTPINRSGSNAAVPEVGDKSPVRIVGVLVGSENYTLGTVKALRFAGDDVVAMAQAIAALAKSSGILPELYVLTDEATAKDRLTGTGATVLSPTKEHWNQVTKNLAAQPLTANDVLYLHLSGHGTASAESGEFVYVLPSARSALGVYFDSAGNRSTDGITASDLSALMRDAKLSKKAMVIDTCAAQAVESGLGENFRKETESAQKAAQVMSNEFRSTAYLLGCPRDAVSFEDPRYGHGILTYSLLEALRNKDLGEDGQVQVAKWFMDARARTQTIATKELGVNQEPKSRANNDFTLGRLTLTDRALIQLPNPRPALCAAAFTSPEGEPLDWLNEQIVEMAASGSASRGSGLVFVPSKSAPAAYTLFGRVTVTGDKIALELNLRQGVGDDVKRHKLPEVKTTRASASKDVLRAVELWLAGQAKQ